MTSVRVIICTFPYGLARNQNGRPCPQGCSCLLCHLVLGGPVQELINSFTKSKLSNFKLKIIGEGPLSLNLNSFTNIEFLGRLENDKVLKLVGLSSAVVSATKLFEGQPNLLCEASSLGVPSIFPKSGGIEEFFPKDYILSFDQYNYDDLIDKLNFLQDKSLAKEIGLKNKAHIEEILKKDSIHYQFEKMVKS